MCGLIFDLFVCYLPSYSYFVSETQCSKEVHHTCTVKKPPVPARADNPPMGIHTKRNFIKSATAVSMKPQPTCVDSSKGHKQLLKNSGLVPKYIKKKVFFFFMFTHKNLRFVLVSQLQQLDKFRKNIKYSQP